jgi:hypothetical protein
MAPSRIAAKVIWIAMFLAVLGSVFHARAAAEDPLETVRSLNADLLTHDSATEVLGRWCAAHGLADPPVIKAVRDVQIDKPADQQVRTLLRIGPDVAVRFRRVRLVCGSHVLSNADNWYLPGRLTPEMNRQLAVTETPFGLVVKPLGFHRVRLEASVLLNPAARTSDASGVLRHEALLVTADGAPFSLVVETYTVDVLALNRPDR